MRSDKLWMLMLLFAVACGGPSYDHVELGPEGRQAAAGTAYLSTNEIRVASGTAAVTTAIAKDDSNETFEGHTLDLVSDNEAVMLVSHSTQASEFVIIGVSQGKAQVRIMIDGREVQRIPGLVVPQKQAK